MKLGGKKKSNRVVPGLNLDSEDNTNLKQQYKGPNTTRAPL